MLEPKNTSFGPCTPEQRAAFDKVSALITEAHGIANALPRIADDDGDHVPAVFLFAVVGLMNHDKHEVLEANVIRQDQLINSLIDQMAKLSPAGRIRVLSGAKIPVRGPIAEASAAN